MIEKFEHRIWLSSPTTHGDELKYVECACEANWLSTVGRDIDQIEMLISEKVGVKNAVALSCGTAALHLAVKLAGIRPGNRVFCTDMTFVASVNPVSYEAGTPIFIDSEYETWNMDPKALEKAFEMYPDTKAVIVTNLYGVPAKLDEICEIANRYGAVVIEDAAESLGATYKGKQTGSFGKFNAISFNGNKIITGSSGGILLTDDDAAAALVRKWSTQSREDALWYQHTEIGYNYRISNIVAGMVRSQMPHLDEHISQKRAIYERYTEGLAELPLVMNPYDAETMEPNFWLSCAVLDDEAINDELNPISILETLESYNVQGRPIWKPMHMQPLYENCEFFTKYGRFKGGEDLSVSADIFRRGLCLPSDNKMTAEEQAVVIEIIKSCFRCEG